MGLFALASFGKVLIYYSTTDQLFPLITLYHYVEKLIITLWLLNFH